MRPIPVESEPKVKKFLKSMMGIMGHEVVVGVPEKWNERPPVENGQEEVKDQGNAYYAWLNENGSLLLHIPARPFMALGMRHAAPALGAESKKAALSIFSDPKKVQTSFRRLGIIAQSAIKKQMQSGEGYPPLSRLTIALRRKRRKSGRAGTKPLIDTGRLYNSIHYDVREVKGARTPMGGGR